ncbi:hypothetical protein MSAN_01622200 [Mycena sanguinolenta]|uniref:Uncharacterized protein n=1 Tax=Mycena sanguinolenta TaxID=230812 RepID=A0A8H7CWI1_9AGAR|nr:hypothetical protein MSAN_01622200 [Mycena sanguinolenta]
MFAHNMSVLSCASILLALAAQTSAHAIPNPALGVKGSPQRSDVRRPTTAKPCGTVNIAANLDTSTAVPAAADGSVSINVENFNPGTDGSTSVSVAVDQTGTGKKFVPATVTTNGNPNPTKVETDKVVFSLPAGTKCTGGKSGNLCLVSIKTTHGFGACTVVSQGKASSNSSNSTVAQLAASQKNKTHINGTCAADSDCRQGCCGFSTGQCAGPLAAQTDGTGGIAPPGQNKGNCKTMPFRPQQHLPLRFIRSTSPPQHRTLVELRRKTPTIAQLAAKQKGKKTVFETCAADRDCQQGCCGFKSGACAGPDVAQTNGSGGCGHGNASPNCNVATLLGFKNCIAGVKNSDLHHPVIQAAAAFTAQLDNLPFTPSIGKRNVNIGGELTDRKRILQQGKFAPRLVKTREAGDAALELEAREYEEFEDLE